jgi:catechol 2,3-dioxygenase-like lactoylglutathione lyase family enzyme
MKLRPMLQVRDVAHSSSWYQSVLGLQSGHGGDEYEMLFAGADFVLQLHHDDPAEHRIPKASGDAGGGSGVTLWFEAEDRNAFEELVQKARAAGAQFLGEPQWNPTAHHHEATVLDPDGYIVVLHSPFEAP